MVPSSSFLLPALALCTVVIVLVALIQAESREKQDKRSAEDRSMDLLAAEWMLKRDDDESNTELLKRIHAAQRAKLKAG